MGPAAQPRVVDHGDRVTVDIPPGTTYAALPLRIEAGDDDAVKAVCMGLADRFALVVMEFDDAMPDGRVLIPHGPEAVTAYDIAADKTAEGLGLTREGREVIEVDPVQMADAMRRRNAARNGIAQADLLPWEQLKESEQRQWQMLAQDAINYVRGI